MADQPYPPLRYVEAYVVEREGEPVVFISDPEGLFSETLGVPLPLFMIMSLLDGQRGAREVQAELARQSGGQILPLADLERFVVEMDEYFLLNNEKAARRRAEVEVEFAALATRPASHAGASYPAAPADCDLFFKKLFLDAGNGLGDPGHCPRGIIVPHIDYQVGGWSIARALSVLNAEKPPKLYIILGVAHKPAKNLFTLTDKSFETPLGLVETDSVAAAKLKEYYGAARLDGEIVHKLEHSVEFPAVALHHLHNGHGTQVKILPILCGSLHEEYLPGAASSPKERPAVGEFIAALKKIVVDYAGDVCFIASVDLSHVGRKFGDEQGVNDLRGRIVRAADEELLKLAEQMDPEAFFNHFRPDANARNVDAVTAVYVMLNVLGQGTGKLIDYDQWIQAETDSLVSFAGMVFY